MWNRLTRRGTVLTLAPFLVVVALASSLAVAGFLSTPRLARDPSPSIRTGSPTAATPAAIATDPPSPRPSQPIPIASPTATPTDDADAMLRAHNELRAEVGAPVLRADERVTAAAQRHAEYLATNGVVGHDETPGAPGFTGATVNDRLAVQGFPATTASEVATLYGSGTDGVRSLWLLPYHRLGLMHPHAVIAGWGHAAVDGRTATVGVLVYDFAVAAPERIRSPASGQRVQPSWAGEEFPDVLPSGASRPVGYPVMVVYSNARPVELRSARITDAGGREIAYHVVPQLYERDYVGIVPAAPLTAGVTYRVRLELRVAGTDVVDEWEFLASSSP